MRRQRFYWTYIVLATVLTIYGGYSLIYNATHDKSLSILGLVFLIVGLVMFTVFLILVLTSIHQKKNGLKVANPIVVKEEPKVEEIKVEQPQEEIKKETPEKKTTTSSYSSSRNDVTYESRSTYRSFDGGSGYVKEVGYGPVLRISEEEILDMRNNIYYRIEANLVKRSGYGPVFEIVGNKIKLAFGGYLYEISGSNVSKTFGGYYASFTGGYLQTHNLSNRYEVPSSLNLKQKLAIVAILFGSY